MNVNVATIALADTASDWQGNNVVANVFKAPLAANGGAVTILEAYVVNQAATTSGTAFGLQLLNYGTAGTASKANVSAALGGTADVFAAGVPKAFTLSAPILDAGEWLVVKKTETNSSDPSRCYITLVYAVGR